MPHASGKPESSEGGNRLRAGGTIFGRGQALIPGYAPSRGLWLIGIAALAIVALAAALPYFASNRIVRDRIALQMSAWSGYDVSIAAAPEIRIWPEFGAVLTDVSFTPRDAPEGPPAIESERIEVKLSPLAALGGEAVFSTVRLIRPVLRVRQTPGGNLWPPLPGGGRLARSIETARGIVAENPGSPEIGRFPADVFGTVEFIEGTIVEEGAEIITGLAGKVEWPALNRPGSAKATGRWRGEPVTLDLASANPLLLFGGGAADMSVTLRSAPASFRFEGTATLAEEPHLEGQGKFLAPSLQRFLEWTGAEKAAAGVPAGSLGIESNISGRIGRLRFEGATVLVNDTPGEGVIDVVMKGGLPVVSGTLAFGSLDLRSFLSAFTPPGSAPAEGPGNIDTEFVDRIGLDLRVSASKATFDRIQLSDVAATAHVGRQAAAFDISDAAAFGGNVQAGIRFRRQAEGSDVEVRLLASEIDGGAFGAAAGLGGLVPIGRGSVSVILGGPGNSWESFLGNANGSITANFGPGAFSGLSLDRFLERASAGGFFALDEISGGTLPIEAAELQANVTNGVARIQKAEARSPLMRVQLSGIVSYAGRGLALSGRIGPAGQDAGEGGQRFFVGGSWRSPYISPVPAARAE